MSLASQVVVYCNLIIVSAFSVFCSVHLIYITFMLLSSVLIAFLPRMCACAARGKVIGLSVICRLLSVSIKIGKSQHLSESRISIWDKMM